MSPLVALALLALASPVRAADPCAELPKPSVTVKLLETPLALNTTYSYRSLTNLGSTQRPVPAGRCSA